MHKWGYWLYKNIVAHDICDAMLSNVDFSNSNEGAVFDLDSKSFVIDERVRITETTWQPWNMPMGSILFSLSLDANSCAGWNFVVDKPQDTQIARYKGHDGNKGAHYDWHSDVGEPYPDGMQRKLSAVLMLSDPSEYGGGELILKTGGREDSHKLTKGSVIVFPSYVEHKVARVTSGMRHTAVGWVLGPAFR